MSEEQTVARIPFHWAVAILVALVLPLAFYLGRFNFALWVCFIAWAEYFTFGGTPKAYKIVLPCWLYGTIMSVGWMLSTVAFTNFMPLMWAAIVTNFLWLTLLVWGLKFYNFGEGVLAVFGGFTCLLALYFTNSMPKVGPMDNPYWVVINTGVWCLILGYFGHFLGWFNVFITFPRKLPVESAVQG